ncbi:(dimethylallyl)adenosine tRNA methylthiotransferase [Raphidocelis subcapitata]|uniref:(Dimethylallyl)adenosine tRNA methylthiotransferase n=1 Tax=Raphidocelis subcapitata TaxID=307507 RepID=A0A2V0PL68_9CHLO|nr:(dimethylallyl)adenosine tRNA methylthiotransferase [Raphidocelis subcapitata]|eukprot:GBF98773.1 (dimethylallyl)adenosine tRNA methylthiotransferase [Raphidocelis subcapitata]
MHGPRGGTACKRKLVLLDKAGRLNCSNEVATERSQRFLGRDLEVLVEGVNPRDPAQAFGRTRHNKLAYFDGDGQALTGRLVTVRIDQANAYSLFGQMRELGFTREQLAADQQLRALLQAHAGELEALVAELTGERNAAREERDTARAGWAEAEVARDAAQGRLAAVAEELEVVEARLQAMEMTRNMFYVDVSRAKRVVGLKLLQIGALEDRILVVQAAAAAAGEAAAAATAEAAAATAAAAAAAAAPPHRIILQLRLQAETDANELAELQHAQAGGLQRAVSPGASSVGETPLAAAAGEDAPAAAAPAVEDPLLAAAEEAPDAEPGALTKGGERRMVAELKAKLADALRCVQDEKRSNTQLTRELAAAKSQIETGRKPRHRAAGDDA